MLQNGAALIAETLNFEHYGVVQLIDDGTVRLRMWNALPDDPATGGPVPAESCGNSDRSASLAAFALATEQPLQVPNLGQEKRFYDKFLLSHGIQSALVVPLPVADQAGAALAGFSRTSRRFSPDDLLFAETIGHLVSTTISRDHAVRVLTEERQFARKVMEAVDSLVLVLSASGRIIRVNRAFELITGFSTAEVQDRPIWNFLLASEEVSAVQEALSRLTSDAKPLEHESFIVTKRGERRRIRWSYAVLTRSASGVDTLIGTGSDVTAQRAAEARAREAEAARNRAQTQLQGILSIVDGGSGAAAAESIPSAPSDATASSDSISSLDTEPAPGPRPFQPLPEDGMADRRHRPRRSFTYCQRIAPMEGDKRPPPSMFRVVQCHDISAGGFAFVSPAKPDHDTFVVVLGSAPVLIYVKVSVAHVTPTKIEGRDVFLVGCKYTGRVDY